MSGFKEHIPFLLFSCSLFIYWVKLSHAQTIGLKIIFSFSTTTPNLGVEGRSADQWS